MKFLLFLIVVFYGRCSAFKLHFYNPVLTVSVSTVTTTETLVAQSTSETYCAYFVNVTGACRRKKGLLIDEPQVMSFDGDSDYLDNLLDPTKVEPLEATEPANWRQERSIFDRMASLSPLSPEGLQSSIGDFLFERKLKKKKKKLKGRAVVTLLKLLTTTSTSTSYLACSTTRTIFIQGCTLSPFPLPICPK